MNTTRLALILVSATSLALLSGCREPNAPQAQSRPAPSLATTADSGSEVAGAPSDTDAARPATLCNIETIGSHRLGADPMALEGSTDVKGWLAVDSGAPPSQPKLVIADSEKNVVREIPIQLIFERPDVVEAYPGQRGLEKSGFKADLDPAGLQPQTYHLYLAYSVGRVSYSCDNGRYLLIR